jgi:hypothetical protein
VRNRPRVVAVTGAMIYGAAGGVWVAKNAGWFGLARDAGTLQLWLGVGVALVLVGFGMAGWGDRLRTVGTLGTVAMWLLIAGAGLNVVSALIGFAILGTLALGLGLVLLAAVALGQRLVPTADRWLLSASAVLSLTWNTETSTVWFLVVNGALWIALSIRLLVPSAQPDLRTRTAR